MITTPETIPLTNKYTNIPNTNSTEGKLIELFLVTGVSVLLVVVVLAVVTITVIAVVGGTKCRKSTKQNHTQNTEQETVTYATLVRQECPEDASNSSNHHIEIIYTDVDPINNKRKEMPNTPYMEEKKRRVALEDMYVVVNKRQKKKQNEDNAPPVYQYIPTQ